MRWSSQSAHEDARRRLPGYRDAVVRRFDAPEALNTRFHEVHAKSALSKVPAQSRVPFSWTVNPYRGCSHGCSYCLWGATPVLMADGRTRAIEDLQVGDEIIGTERRGRCRRYVRTRVLDHWSTIKPVWEVGLQDGTRLLASGDHRFLTRRGWRHVEGSPRTGPGRPHLTLDDRLRGTGGFAGPPCPTEDYKRGYLCGLIRGDGHPRAHGHRGTDGPAGGLRLALTDAEALRRAHTFLSALGAAAYESSLAGAGAGAGIRPGARSTVERSDDLIRFPEAPDQDWRKGFLAGIFDAGGSCDGPLRIRGTDGVLLQWTRESLHLLGFETAEEDRRGPGAPRVVRICGGLEERLRFLHLTDPAITRKRTVEGIALESGAELRVVSVRPLGIELPLYDITTGTGDFIADGVVSHNCFARPTHEYLGFNPGEDFEREIVVKVNVPEVLRAELARPSWTCEPVAMGTNTDPYQWVEGRYKLMRGIWQALRDARNPCSILTKSPLLLRDLDLMRQIAEVTDISACLSVPTLDEKAWRATEPHTPNPRARLEAVAELNRAGIPTGILIAPLMPGINDAPEQVAEIVELATEAGATSIGGQPLFLRGSVRHVFFEWLREHRPDLLPRYEELYRRGAYLPEQQRREIERAAGVPWLASEDRRRWRHRVIERRHRLEREARDRAAEAAARRRGVSDAQEALF